MIVVFLASQNELLNACARSIPKNVRSNTHPFLQRVQADRVRVEKAVLPAVSISISSVANGNSLSVGRGIEY